MSHWSGLSSIKSRKSISRRQFLAFTGVASLAGLLAACGGGGNDDEPTATTASETQGGATQAAGNTSASPSAVGTANTSASPSAGGKEEPRKGGILHISTSSYPANFDLHQNSSFTVLYPMQPCYSLIVQYSNADPHKLEPDLAESWEFSEDGKTGTFKLRKGVKFHHGKEMDSDDVKISISYINNPPEGTVSPRSNAFATLESIDVPDKYTVVFHLKRATPSFLLNLGQGWMAIYPKDVLTEKGSMKADVVGTGPFKLKNATEGVSVELERNPDYYMPDRPYLDGIKFFVINDPNTESSNFISGQLHMVGVSTRQQGEKITKQLGSAVTMHKWVTTSNQKLEMNAKHKPWDDDRVRQACNLAIDRNAANQFLANGDGVLSGILYPLGPWALSSDELQQIPGFTLDPDKKKAEYDQAKKLLAEAGYADGLSTSMLVRQGQEFEATAVFLQNQLKQVGIDAKLNVFETATFYEKEDARDFDLFGGSASEAIDDPDSRLYDAYVTGGGRNYSNYSDPEFDKMVDAQSEELDPAKRKELVQKACKYALTNALKAPLGFRVTFWLQYNTVKGYQKSYSQYITETHRDTWLSS